MRPSASFEAAEAELELRTRSIGADRSDVETRPRVSGPESAVRGTDWPSQRAARQAAAERAAIAEARQRDLSGEFVGKGSTEPIAVGDMLVIAIDGEPDLPANYRVSRAGTVRLPLLDTFSVSGRTAVDVETDIRRALDGARPERRDRRARDRATAGCLWSVISTGALLGAQGLQPLRTRAGLKPRASTKSVTWEISCRRTDRRSIHRARHR